LTDKRVGDLRERTAALFTLRRAPSQASIFQHLLETGRSLTVKELASELGLTEKAAERAVAKLLEKGLVQRSTFREGSYICDVRLVVSSMLRVLTDLYEDYESRR